MGGFETSLFLDQPIKDDFVCHVCHSVFDKPMSVCKDGHTFCETCLEAWKSRSNSCPQCRTDMHAIPVLNRIVQNLILEMRVKCPETRQEPDAKRIRFTNDSIEKEEEEEEQSTLHCGWEGTLADYIDKHRVKECRFARVKCVCHQMIRVYDLEHHKSNECTNRRVDCGLCQKPMVFYLLKRHIKKTCPKAQVKCTDCGASMERQELGIQKRDPQDNNAWKYTGHLAECPKLKLECAFAAMGCTHKVAREDMKQHHADFGNQHARLVSTEIQSIRADRSWTPRTMHWRVLKTRLQDLLNDSSLLLKSQDITTGDYRCYLRLHMDAWNKINVHVCVKDYELTPRIDRLRCHWDNMRTNQFCENQEAEQFMMDDEHEEAVAVAGGPMKMELLINDDEGEQIAGWVPIGVDTLIRRCPGETMHLTVSFRLAGPENVRVEEDT